MGRYQGKPIPFIDRKTTFSIQSSLSQSCLFVGCLSSDAVTSIFRETKSKVGGEHALIMMTIHECSLASGSSLIPRLVEVCCS
jgi:hypothetical protein